MFWSLRSEEMSFSRNYEKCYFSGSFTKARQLANFEIYGKIFWESNFTIKVSNISENQDILKTQQSQLPRSYEKTLLIVHMNLRHYVVAVNE